MAENKLSQATFYCPKLTKNWLEKNGFKYSKVYSSAEDGAIYTLRFPVVSWNLYVTVEAEIMFNATDNIAHINCYDKGTRSIYAAWYSYYYGNYSKIVDDINTVIEKKIKKMGLLERTETRETLFGIPRKDKDESCS